MRMGSKRVYGLVGREDSETESDKGHGLREESESELDGRRGDLLGNEGLRSEFGGDLIRLDLRLCGVRRLTLIEPQLSGI